MSYNNNYNNNQNKSVSIWSSDLFDEPKGEKKPHQQGGDRKYDNNNRNNNNNRNDRNYDNNKKNDYDKKPNHHNNNGDNKHNNNNRDPYQNRLLSHIFAFPGKGIKSGTMTNDVVKLFEKGGLRELIVDVYRWRNKGDRRPDYAVNALNDPLFVSAMRKKGKKIIKELLEGDGDYKKQIEIFNTEINSTINHFRKNGRNMDKSIYTTEIVEDIIEVYTGILAKSNKKVAKKLVEKLGLTKDVANTIAIITAGGSPSRSLYNLNNYIYSTDILGDDNKVSSKKISKIYNICFDKDSDIELLSHLMLERNVKSRLEGRASDTWSEISEYLLEKMNVMTTYDIEKVVVAFVRRRQIEDKLTKTPRRLGDTSSIHPDDYKNLYNTIRKIENEDLTIKIWMRNN